MEQSSSDRLEVSTKSKEATQRPAMPWNMAAVNPVTPVDIITMEGGAGMSSKGYNNEGGDRKLIVNYLPQMFTTFELRNLFAPYGEIESCKVMKDAKTGYSFGYGFVNFVREEDALQARIEMHGVKLSSNKRLKVSIAKEPSEEIKHANLYVSNLPRKTTESELVKLFEPYGTIIHNKLLCCKFTKMPRGVAFVRYETREQAFNAIKALHEVIPEGHSEPLRVRVAEDHGKRRAHYLAGLQAGMGISSRNSSSSRSHHHSPRSSRSCDNSDYRSYSYNNAYSSSNSRSSSRSHHTLYGYGSSSYGYEDQYHRSGRVSLDKITKRLK